MDFFQAKGGDAPPEWQEAGEAEHLSQDELLDALADGSGRNSADERRLRILIWWVSNDRFRHSLDDEDPPKTRRRGRSPRATPLSDRERENMTILYALLRPLGSAARLMKAEVARELGEFGRCLDLLGGEFPPPFDATAVLIERLAGAGVSKVAEIPQERSQCLWYPGTPL
jgi:hypothetical protein